MREEQTEHEQCWGRRRRLRRRLQQMNHIPTLLRLLDESNDWLRDLYLRDIERRSTQERRKLGQEINRNCSLRYRHNLDAVLANREIVETQFFPYGPTHLFELNLSIKV